MEYEQRPTKKFVHFLLNLKHSPILLLSSVLGDAGGYSCWDTGRGIFHNKDKTFLTWLNEEDHFRFISMQMGGDLGAVYKRLVDVRLSNIDENSKTLN